MYNKIDWKKKLSSRKFWMAIVGFITALLTAFNIEGESVAQITSIVMAFGTLIAYILAEGFIDGKREEGNITNIINTEELKDRE